MSWGYYNQEETDTIQISSECLECGETYEGDAERDNANVAYWKCTKCNTNHEEETDI
jgi:hypothetical protein